MLNGRFCLGQVRRLSQAALEKLRLIPNEGLIWKANEEDPRKHTANHESLFYLLPQDSKELLSIFGTSTPFDPDTGRFHKIIGLSPVMVRKPALTALNYFEKFKDSMPNIRLLFFGDEGHGKTHTLVHLIHFLSLKQDHIIVNIQDARKFSRSAWEIAESTSRSGRIDTPVNAAIFLQQFKMQNAKLLEKLNETLVCSKDYKWSAREETKAGDPIVDLVEHGINRVIHASDCVAVLLKELMLAADEGKIKLASVIDYILYLFQDEARDMRHTDNRRVFVDEITVARAIKKLIKGVYKNGVVLATCEEPLSRKQNTTPRQILGVEGWEHFDPCLPIHVPKYSRKEFESCMNFYQAIGWLARPEALSVEVRDEIRFISGLNPKEVFYLCKSL